MSRTEFHKLLERYLAGKCTAEEAEVVDQWYRLLDDESLPLIPAEEMALVEQRLWNKLNSETSEIVLPSVNKKRYFISSYAAIRIAASVLLFTCAAFAYFYLRLHDSERIFLSGGLTANSISAKNQTGKPATIKLEDGSSVTLQPGSELRYPIHFRGSERDVYLKGEAFFEVSKNASRPFFVYSDKLITHVVGTSFTVKTNNRLNKAEVVVKTGRVIVSEIDRSIFSVIKVLTGKKEVVLTPNQKTTYSPENKNFETTLVDAPVPVVKRPGFSAYNFNDATVENVLKSLSSTYGIKIEVANKKIEHCTFTGDISEHSLYQKLSFICESINASYEINGTTILIKGQGCN